MRIRLAVSLFAFAVALVGASLAQAMAYEIRTTGTVVSKTADALVVRIDDHGHHIRFDVERSTILPGDLATGRHVAVTYHPTGSVGQAADSVVVVPAGDQRSTAWATPPAGSDTRNAMN